MGKLPDLPNADAPLPTENLRALIDAWRFIHYRDQNRYQGQAVRIDRGTRYGNPHRIGYCSRCALRARPKVHHTRDEAIDVFKHEWLSDAWETVRQQALREIPPDAVLVCWCAPRPCHGSIIAEWLNAQRQAS